MQNNFAENFYSDAELFKEFREEYGTITAKRMYEYVKLSEINSKSDLSEELKFLLGMILSNQYSTVLRDVKRYYESKNIGVHIS